MKKITQILFGLFGDFNKRSAVKNDNASSQLLYLNYIVDFKPTKKAKRIFFFLYAIKFFTEMYNFKNDIIPNHYQLVQACGNINIIFYDKKKNEFNKNKKSLEKTSYNKIKSKAATEREQKEEKAKLKRLKEAAEIKIKQKINKLK